MNVHFWEKGGISLGLASHQNITCIQPAFKSEAEWMHSCLPWIGKACPLSHCSWCVMKFEHFNAWVIHFPTMVLQVANDILCSKSLKIQLEKGRSILTTELHMLPCCLFVLCIAISSKHCLMWIHFSFLLHFSLMWKYSKNFCEVFSKKLL